MDFKNYHANYEPETTLYKEETEVIVAAIKNALRYIDRSGIEGSFVLLGQEDGQSKMRKHIIEFDFDYGLAKNYYRNKSSRWAVNYVADRVFKMSFDYDQSVIHCLDDELDEEFLSLDTTNGRFICVAAIGEFPYCEVEVYLAVAKALAMMHQDDPVLQTSYRRLLLEEAGIDPDLYDLDEYLAEMFDDKCRHQPDEVAAWKKWADETSEDLRLYFD